MASASLTPVCSAVASPSATKPLGSRTMASGDRSTAAVSSSRAPAASPQRRGAVPSHRRPFRKSFEESNREGAISREAAIRRGLSLPRASGSRSWRSGTDAGAEQPFSNRTITSLPSGSSTTSATTAGSQQPSHTHIGSSGLMFSAPKVFMVASASTRGFRSDELVHRGHAPAPRSLQGITNLYCRPCESPLRQY
jgi:hypothetical protein